MTAHEKFTKDMRSAGYTVRNYSGRFNWEGPAVAIESRYELQDVIRATSIRVQTDDLGKGLIVYPIARKGQRA